MAHGRQLKRCVFAAAKKNERDVCTVVRRNYNEQVVMFFLGGIL